MKNKHRVTRSTLLSGRRKKIGAVNLAKHRIGDRTSILFYIGGISAVSLLQGCSQENAHVYTSHTKCQSKYTKAQCDAAFDTAEKEAKRTALRYLLEKECRTDFGPDVCVERKGYWQPKMAGFVVDHMGSSAHIQPFFTTSNPRSHFYRKAFFANGDIFQRSTNIDGHAVDFHRKDRQPFCTSKIGQLVETGPNESCHDVSKNVTSNTGLFLDGLAKIKHTDQVSYQPSNSSYSDSHDDSNNYYISSGTARTGSSGGDSHYHSSRSTYSNSNSNSSYQSSSHSSYHATKPVATRSYGGFGSTGSARGGFFGG
ncbi:DUF1190 domain-containing protein [Vibrio sp. S4M6]|uniref:DUF1190 domain-containing protein n=1 Tax=Vibrio sinus TaxID=2946865 RepID=UPI00202A4276|nr:DUF1190 domain-containing protein [Vibrio sinus]MCL9781717.1 DUF1190 domain-containing protein [Vibrio sinus]